MTEPFRVSIEWAGLVKKKKLLTGGSPSMISFLTAMEELFMHPTILTEDGVTMIIADW